MSRGNIREVVGFSVVNTKIGVKISHVSMRIPFLLQKIRFIFHVVYPLSIMI